VLQVLPKDDSKGFFELEPEWLVVEKNIKMGITHSKEMRWGPSRLDCPGETHFMHC
jgi:hypothetical protein